MNKTYKRKDNKVKKRLLTVMLMLAFVACSLGAASYADVAANTLPSLNATINGKVEDITSGGTTTGLNVITQGGTGAVGQFDWNTFDVGKDMTVNWAFTGQAQTALNRVLSNNLSQIYGKLTSSCSVGNCSYGNSSKVILINPNGLLFGNGSQVNINSFTASTFDAVGAKNIKDLGSEYNTYAAGLDKFGYNKVIRFQGSTSAPGNTVKLEGSTWNIDKSAAIVAQDIVMYKDSLISTNMNYNYGSGTQNFSNVKLVTSNGVDFKYLAGGYIENGSVNVLPGLSGVDYTMQIGSDNPAVNTANHGTGAQYDAKIASGNVLLQNGGTTANSNIKIQKAAIKGNKLVNYANGDIAIIAEGQINIDDSDIETHNTYEVGKESVNTYSALGGDINILGKKGVDVNASRIASAYSLTNASPAGDITIQAETSGDVKVKGSSIIGQGNILLKANEGNVNIDTTIAQAENMQVPANLKNLEIFGKKGVTATGSTLSGSKDTTINSTSGDVSLVGNGKIYAGDNLNLYGNNTLVERSALSYKNLNLYNGSQVNNVTFKGTTTLQDRDSTTGLVINTNGNLTVDGNELKTRTPGQAYADAQNQTKITLNSAKNITVKNSSSVKSAGEITMNANNGDVTVADSTVKSTGSNVKLNASNSNNVTNSTLEAALNNNLTAATSNNVTDSYLTASKNNVLTAAAANIECSELTAENNDVSGTAGSITVKNSKVNATQANMLHAKNNVTSTNSIFNAKANIISATTGAATFTNSKLIAVNDNIVDAGGNVVFKYDSTLNAQCTGAGCDGPVANEVTAGSNRIKSSNGNVEISNTPFKATSDYGNTITADLGNVKIKDSILDAAIGVNTIKGNNVDIECSDLSAITNRSEAVSGNQTVTNTNATALVDNIFKASNNFTTTNSIYTAGSNAVTATAGAAAFTNSKLIATSTNNVKASGNVTFKYDKTLNKQCTGAGCDGPVENAVTAGLNIVNSSKGNVEISDTPVTATLSDNIITADLGDVKIKDSTIKAKADNTVKGNNVDIECSDLIAVNNTSEAVKGNQTITNTNITATNKNTVTASNNVTSTNSILTAKANAVTATAGAAAFTNSKLIATDTNNVKASGNVTFKYDSALNKQCTGAGCDGPVANEVTAGSNTITSSKGNVEISDTPVTATVGNNTITADLGDVKIKDSTLNAKGDNTVKGNNVDIECSDLIATNNKSEAVKGNQTVTNTNATATNNNTFTASNNYTTVNSIYTAKNNTITAAAGKIDATNVKLAATGKNTVSAKGNVTFDYDKTLNKQCTGAGCDGPVGTELKGNNDISSTDGDVTMTGKLTPNDPTKPEDTKTTITAGGDVKTKARVVYDDLYDKTGTIIGEGPLDTQGTKLVINTKGNVNLVLTNTDNVKAGLEIANASTNPAKDNKIEIIAQDGTLAISRMVTDDLFIHQPNYHLAGQTVLSAADKAVDSYAPTNSVRHQSAPGVEADMAGRAYIEVKHGFNQDYAPSKVEQSGIYQASFNEETIAGGTVYHKHFINLPDGDNTAVKGEFVLSYTKPYECDPEPPMTPDLSDEIGKVTIPLEADIFQQGIITNNLTDPTVGIIAAAAAIVIEDEEQTSDY